MIKTVIMSIYVNLHFNGYSSQFLDSNKTGVKFTFKDYHFDEKTGQLSQEFEDNGFKLFTFIGPLYRLLRHSLGSFCSPQLLVDNLSFSDERYVRLCNL